MLICQNVWLLLDNAVPRKIGLLHTAISMTSAIKKGKCCNCCTVYGQAEQTKYEARIVGLQRAKQEAIAKADAQDQRASALHLELEKLTIEKTRYVQYCRETDSLHDSTCYESCKKDLRHLDALGLLHISCLQV